MLFAISRAVYLALLLGLIATTADIVSGGRAAHAAVGIDVSDAHNANEAEAFVQASIDRGYRILNNKELSANDRQMQFRQFLSSITETKRVALFTLGTYARSAAQSDIDRFLAAYDEF